MASAPLSVPTGIRFGEWTLAMVHTRDASMLEGRRLETADFGTPYWSLTAKTQGMTISQADEFEDFLFRAMRPGATFVCPDLYRKRPRPYGEVPLTGTKALGGAFNGDADVHSIQNSRQVTIEGLPANFLINRGALIEFRNSALVRSLHRVTTAVQSMGGYVLPGYVEPGYVLPFGDGKAVVNFEPPLNTGVFTTSSTAHLEKPSCIMMLTGYDMPKAQGSRVASFTATEAFFS